MGNYEDLKAAIADVIYQNGNNEITGLLLQQTLLSIVNNLGEYATFGGIATPDTNPGTADQNVYYLATEAGTYVNFGGIVINKGEAVILSNETGAWVKHVSGFSTKENFEELQTIIGLDFFKYKMSAIRTDGSMRASVENIDATDYLPICGRVPITFIGGWTNLSEGISIVPLAFYDEKKNFISYATGASQGFTIAVEDIPANAKYIRCTAYTVPMQPVIYGCTLGSIWDNVANAIVTKGVLADGSDLNDITLNGVYLLDSTRQYVNAALSVAFLWVVTLASTITLQLLYSFSGATIKKRRKFNNTWEAWQDITNNDINLTVEVTPLDITDLNQVGGNVVYLMDESHYYQNAPYSNAIGFLRVTTPGSYTLQEFYPFSGNKLYKRRGIVNGVWTAWGEIAGTNVINNITNQYSYPQYNNQYNIEVTPTIEQGGDNILISTQDTTDRTAAIVAMLQTTGVCRLGYGVYYVNNLEMPDNTMIMGIGPGTRVVLVNGGNYAIKMNKNCCVKDLTLSGNVTDISVSENIEERHGILWAGNYNESQNNNEQPQRGHIENLWISSFSGGGITCYDTGYGTITNLMAVNVNIWNCTVGLNISYWSEFHKFVNVRCALCYYGCINNGGNNIFESCDFSSNLGVAFLMDNSQDQSPNNSHGSAIGCVFNHTASNQGVGIKILGNQNGFIFSGCQIFYSQILIENSDGIVVSDTNFGYANCNITINGEGVILFANNMFQRRPPISIANNSRHKFVNCFDRNTGLEMIV